jgi:predicted ATPase/GAF domain-containing protein
MSELPRYTLGETVLDAERSLLRRGRRDANGAPVLVKLLKGSHPSPREIAKLGHEYAVTRDIAHPSVLRPEALERRGTGLGLVAEGFPGVTLRSLFDARRLSLEEALRITDAIAEALGATHAARVVHKDIRPENILVDVPTGKIKLTGFGIASRLTQELEPAEGYDVLEGSLAYISPEQTGRMNRATDYRTDFYSLGVTMFEMLTGELPFSAREPMDLVHAHIARMPPEASERARAVPAAVSAITAKLLAKAAEDRYQSAYGLRADLATCLAGLSETGEIAPFPLGQRDSTGELRLPQRLYHREAEFAALAEALDRARRGEVDALFISGYAGVGKTSLVGEFQKSAARRLCYYARGNFDPQSGSAPYDGLARAFRGLLRQLLAESRASLEATQARLLDALGQSGRALYALLPELGLLLGPLPGVPELGPAEAQNRMRLLFQALVRALARPERPLVVFLDDIQWAEPASFHLIEALLTDPDMRGLLVIGAYGDADVGEGHPLALLLGRLGDAGRPARALPLEPLPRSATQALVADALLVDHEVAAPLAAFVFERTEGNPLFINQLLTAMHDERLVTYDAEARRFCWDDEAVRRMKIADGVAQFIAEKLRRLSSPGKRLISLAACVGHQFDLATLSVVYEAPPSETAAVLWEALRQGFVVPTDPAYRFLEAGSSASMAELVDTAFRDVGFAFLHDHVQQAAASLIPEAERRAAHLRIGRLLWAKAGGAPRDEEIFALLRHLGEGAALVDDPQERLDIARLYLSAGRRAKAGAAFDSAADYLRAGADFLGPEGFEADHDLAFALTAERAECDDLTSAFDEAESLFDVLLLRAHSPLERARVRELCVVHYTTTGKFDLAVRAGREGLGELGVLLPEGDEAERAASASIILDVLAQIAAGRLDALSSAPELDGASERATASLLSALTAPAFYTPALFALVTAMQVEATLAHGRSESTALALVTFANNLAASSPERREEARALRRVAEELESRGEPNKHRCKFYVFLGLNAHIFEAIRASIPRFERAMDAGLASGDFASLSQAALHIVLAKFVMGSELSALAAESTQRLSLMARTQNAFYASFVTSARQMIANLRGETRGRQSLSDDAFDEDAFLRGLDASGYVLVRTWHHAIKAELLFMHGEPEEALREALLAEADIARITEMCFVIEVYFYGCLAILALPSAAQGVHTATLERLEERLAACVESWPDSFQHKPLLVAAERARVSGDDIEAGDLYDRAIELAGDEEYTQDEALANELCAKFYLARRRRKVARVYMTDAYHGYLRWGATAKAEDLAAMYPTLIAAPEIGPSQRSRRAAEVARGAGVAPGSLLDAAAVVQAAQTVAQEIVLDRALEKLLGVALASAGAQRGALVLTRDDRLVVEATATITPDAVTAGIGAPLEERQDLSAAVVQYVARTMEPVLLADAQRDERFADDPYVASGAPRSVMCVAMSHHERLTGVLYLENNAADRAFTEEHVALAELLVAQAAIAIENARLYEQARVVGAELQRANEDLEATVSRRTDELRASNAQLSHELSQREQAEEERARLQGRVLEAQARRLLELSTPIIPITDRIVVMPLIGALDAERAAQVLEVALSGAQAHRAEVVILDITGVRDVDAAVAGTLLRAASALRLLGVKALISGVAPAVAQALAALEVDVGALSTMGTLQNAIAFALKRTGEGGLRGLGGGAGVATRTKTRG